MRATMHPSRSPSDYRFTHEVRVRFAETDAMGIVHHSRYLPYLEEARVAYLRSIDRPYSALRAEGIDIAVLEVTVQYIRPLRFDDIVTVHVLPGEATRTSFQIGYLLTVDGGEGVQPCSTAVTVHGCLDQATGRPVRLPEWLRSL